MKFFDLDDALKNLESQKTPATFATLATFDGKAGKNSHIKSEGNIATFCDICDTGSVPVEKVAKVATSRNPDGNTQPAVNAGHSLESRKSRKSRKGKSRNAVFQPPAHPSTVDGQAPSRADLEALHPATVNGIPLAAILDQADPSDYPDLADPATLEAFAASLVATGYIGYIDPVRYGYAPKRAVAGPSRPVRCCDCRHHAPSATDPRHGIGSCRVETESQLRPAPWPGTARRCDEFETREDHP